MAVLWLEIIVYDGEPMEGSRKNDEIWTFMAFWHFMNRRRIGFSGYLRGPEKAEQTLVWLCRWGIVTCQIKGFNLMRYDKIDWLCSILDNSPILLGLHYYRWDGQGGGSPQSQYGLPPYAPCEDPHASNVSSPQDHPARGMITQGKGDYAPTIRSRLHSK